MLMTSRPTFTWEGGEGAGMRSCLHHGAVPALPHAQVRKES